MPRNIPGRQIMQQGRVSAVPPMQAARMPTVPPFYSRSRLERSPDSSRLAGDTPETPIAPEREMERQRQEGTVVTQQYGMEYLRRKKVIRPFDYTLDNVTPATPFTIAANAAATGIITIFKEHDFELQKLMCVCDVPAFGIIGGRGDDLLFRIRDDRKGMYLSNNFIHMLAGTGSGIFPLILPDSKFFGRSSTISIEMVNQRAFPINVWWTLRGRGFYAREFENLTDVPDFSRLSKQAREFFIAKQKKSIEPFMYTLDNSPVTLAALATQQDVLLSIRQEGDFEIFAYTAYSDQPFSVLIRESNTGRFLTNRPIASNSAIGDGERPALLAEPLFLDANSQLLITFTNLSVNVNNIYFTLIGRKWLDTASMNLVTGPEFYMDKFEAL